MAITRYPFPKSEGYPSPTAERIMESLLPEWKKQFLQANEEYGEDPDPIGPVGEVVEIVRKSRKLRRRFIQGYALNRETPREVVMDLIGHGFLLLALLDDEQSVEAEDRDL